MHSAMSEEAEKPRFREHLRELRTTVGKMERDVAIDVTNAPHLAKEGTKNALARAAGVRKTPMREWTETASEESP